MTKVERASPTSLLNIYPINFCDKSLAGYGMGEKDIREAVKKVLKRK